MQPPGSAHHPLLDADVIGGQPGAAEQHQRRDTEQRARPPAPPDQAERDQGHVRPALPDAERAGRQASQELQRQRGEQDRGAHQREQQRGAGGVEGVGEHVS